MAIFRVINTSSLHSGFGKNNWPLYWNPTSKVHMIKWSGLWVNLCICAGSRLDMLCIQGCYSPDLPWLTVAFLCSPASLLSEQGIQTITSAKWNAPEVSKLLWKKWTLITFWTVKMCFIWGEAQLKRNYCSPVPTESREVFLITPQEHCNFFFPGQRFWNSAHLCAERHRLGLTSHFFLLARQLPLMK